MSAGPKITVSTEIDTLRVEHLAKKALADALQIMRDGTDAMLRQARMEEALIRVQIEARDGE